MEIVPGIHQIDRVRGANCYLVVSGTGTLVIDTGMPGNGNKIIKYVESIGIKPADISYIVLTHGDIDHIGSAAELKKMTGAKLAIHANDAPTLAGRSGFKKIKGPLGILFKLMRPLLRFHPVEPEIILKANDDIAGFKVIFTPGHTNGSISLYQPGKILFAGDALRSDAKGNPIRPSERLSVDREQAEASLTAIAKLEFDILLPGHGAPVTGRASDKVRNLVP